MVSSSREDPRIRDRSTVLALIALYAGCSLPRKKGSSEDGAVLGVSKSGIAAASATSPGARTTMTESATPTELTESESSETSTRPSYSPGGVARSTATLWQRRETRRTFKAEDGKTYFLPKCVHFRPESSRHARASLHLQLSAGLYLCNGERCSDRGGNVDFKATHVVTKAQVLVLRAFRDLMGWRPYGEPASPLHELLAGEVFRLWEKTRRANDPSAPDIEDDEPVRISPAPHKFGEALPKDVEVTIKAGVLRQACKEKRKRATAIYDSLCSDPLVLAGSLEEAPPDAYTSSKHPPRLEEYRAEMEMTANVRQGHAPAPMMGNVGGNVCGPSSSQPSPFRIEGDMTPRIRETGDLIGRRAISSLISTIAERCTQDRIREKEPERHSETRDHRHMPAEEPRHISVRGFSDSSSHMSDDAPFHKRQRIRLPSPDREPSLPSERGCTPVGPGDLNVGYPGPGAPMNGEGEVRRVGAGDPASAARRQLWYREVQANDARLKAIKEEAEREHAERMRQLMSWIVDEEGGKHNGLGANAGPEPARWER